MHAKMCLKVCERGYIESACELCVDGMCVRVCV